MIFRVRSEGRHNIRRSRFRMHGKFTAVEWRSFPEAFGGDPPTGLISDPLFKFDWVFDQGGDVDERQQ